MNRRDVAKVRDANFYFFIEASIALFVSFIINVFVVSVFAHGLYDKTNNEIVSCTSISQSDAKFIPTFHFSVGHVPESINYLERSENSIPIQR